MKYTCKGSVRGTCGHQHRTLRGAAECLLRDEKRCSRLGGGAYSDRDVVRQDGQPLTDDERSAVVDVLHPDR